MKGSEEDDGAKPKVGAARTAPPPERDAGIGWLLARVAMIAVGFAVLAAPLGRVGHPDSPAYEMLENEIDGVAGKPKPAPLDYAVLGNSRPHVGIWPKLLSDTIASEGLRRPRGHNFSVDGTDSMHHASFGTNGLLAVASPPRVIIWAVDPLMFDSSRKANRLEQLERSDVPRLLASRAPFELVLDVAAMQIFPPYRHRPLVLAKVEDKTEGMGKRLTKVQRIIGLENVDHPAPRSYDEEPDGFMPFKVIADWEYRFYQRHAVHYAAEYEKLTLSEWHARFAARFLAKAREKGVVVVLLEMPEAPYYREHFASGKKHQAWRKQIMRLAEDEGAIFWNDAERYASDKDFGDPGHMPRQTAEDYTRALAQKLAKEPRVREALERGSPTSSSSEKEPR